MEEVADASAGTSYRTVEVGALYDIAVPDFMFSTSAVSDDASLQYNNLYKEKYVIVVDEPKDEFVEAFEELGLYDSVQSVLDNYALARFTLLSEGAEVLEESGVTSMDINGLPGRVKSYDANVFGVPETVSYFLGFVEGEEQLYMIMAWTLKSRKDDYVNEAMTMIKSFREKDTAETETSEKR